MPTEEQERFRVRWHLFVPGDDEDVCDTCGLREFAIEGKHCEWREDD